MRSQVQAFRLPNAQVSQNPQDYQGVLSWFEDTLDGYPGQSRERVTRILRGLAESDDDVNGTLRDLRSLCGAGFNLDFTGGARAIKNAEAALADFMTAIYPEGGGASGLVLHQVAEFALAGASSLEWVPQRNRRGIERVEVVPAEEIRIRRDATTRALMHEQWAIGETVALNPLTYRYGALLTSGRRPAGVPLFVASLFSLSRKRQLLDAEQRVINLMARSALIQAKIKTPSAQALGVQSEKDPRYAEAVQAFYSTAANLIMSASENGLYLGTENVEMQVIPVAQTAAGAADITRANQHRVWNGLGSQPYLRGEMDSTTQALAQVTVPMLYAQAVMVQGGIASALEFGFNLHLRLLGIPATAYVKFEAPKSPFLLDEAAGMLNRAKAHEILAQLFGPAWAQSAMRDWDIAEGDAARAPDWWKPGADTTDPAPDPGGPT